MTLRAENAPMGDPDPAAIYQLATGYWPAAVLLAANELGVFPALAAGGQTAPQVAQTIAGDPRAVAMLLNACGALGLVMKTGEQYELTPAAQAFLTPGRPGYLGSALYWSQDQYAAWGRLADAIRTGQPVVAPESHLGADPAQTRAFVLAMHERAKGVARGVVEFLDLAGCRSVLDVGGGPGTYASLLAQKYPEMRITVRDLPAVTAVARELITSDRVRLLAGDATAADYGEAEYDAVLFCGVLHQFSPAVIQRMLAGAHRALVAGGRVVVCDMMLDASQTQPVFSTLFSLQMLLTSHGGGVFSGAECERWLVTAGCGAAHSRALPPPLPYTVISARKATCR